MVEAGKNLQSAVNVFLLLIVVCVAFVTTPADQNIAVPFIGISLPTPQSADVVLALVAASVYRLYSLILYERLLWLKLDKLLTKAGWDTSTWAIEYPSEYSFFQRMESIDGTRYGIFAITVWAMSGISAIVPVGILIWLGYVQSFSRSWLVTATVTLLLLGATFRVWLLTPSYEQKDEVLGKIETQ